MPHEAVEDLVTAFPGRELSCLPEVQSLGSSSFKHGCKQCNYLVMPTSLRTHMGSGFTSVPKLPVND